MATDLSFREPVIQFSASDSAPSGVLSVVLQRSPQYIVANAWLRTGSDNPGDNLVLSCKWISSIAIWVQSNSKFKLFRIIYIYSRNCSIRYQGMKIAQ